MHCMHANGISYDITLNYNLSRVVVYYIIFFKPHGLKPYLSLSLRPGALDPLKPEGLKP